MDFTFPPMKEYDLSNGMHCMLIPDFTHPIVTVTLQIPIGRYLDKPSFEGTAELALGLIQKGTKTYSSEVFSQKIEQSGASLFADLKDECLTLGVRMLKSVSQEIVPLFWDMVCNPALDEKEFARLKKEMLTGLNAEFSDPSVLAGKHFNAALFGAEHPAGRKHSVYTVKNIALQDIKDYYAQYCTAEESTIIVAGAMTEEEMQKEWESLFSSWTKKRSSSPAFSAKDPVLPNNRVRIVDKPELSQTTLLIGHPAIPEMHESRVNLALANFIFGGGNFSSRLMSRIRSKIGKTYGIVSQIVTNKRLGAFTVSTTTQNSHLKEVLFSIFDEYREFCEQGPTNEEVEKAKQFALGNMAFELEGIPNIVEKLLWLRFYGRENSFIEDYSQHLSPITAQSIRDALKEFFKSDHFVIIAVGKQKEIEMILREYGEVTSFKHRENPLKP